MPALVGVQKDMQDVVDQLIRMELEDIGSYETALARVRSVPTRETLLAFRDDHVRHWKELANVARRAGRVPPARGDQTELPYGRLAMAKLDEERAMLSALRLNDHALHTLYERWSRSPVVPVPLRYLLRECCNDERRHRAWLQKQLPTLAQRGATATSVP